MKKIDRTGEIGVNNLGYVMEIISYNNYDDIDVKFESGYISYHNTYRNFKNGEIKVFCAKDIYGVACLGQGKYFQKKSDASTLMYRTWVNMLMRCYSKQYKQKYTTYQECTACEEWLNFQNFAKWYVNNYYEIDEPLNLDKDILQKNNKLYSPDACLLVPQRINKLFIKGDSCRGSYYIGVTYLNKINKYIARCNTITNRQYLGVFETEEAAFTAYKDYKENYIKQIAEEYKNKIPEKLYNALYTWKVQKTD